MDKMKVAALIREIGNVAPRVGQEYAQQQAAFEAERKTRIHLLTRAIDLAKPGLEAISNTVLWTDPEAGWCGFPVVDEWGSDSEPWKPDMTTRIYLAPDGTMFEALRWDDAGAPRPLLHKIDVSDAAERYDVGEMIEALHNAIMRQLGKRYRSTEEATNDARKLGAILTLLD